MKLSKGNPFAIVLLLGFAIVQTVLAPSARAATNDLHSIWKVGGKRSAVYLVGSVHCLKPDNYPLAAPIESAFTNSQIAAFEADLDEMESPDAQLKMVGKTQLPEGETLEQQLSPATYAALSKYATEQGLPIVMFQQFKPAIACMALEVMTLQKLGFDPELGLDKHFYAQARKDHKQVVALETVDFQVDLITGLSKAESELFVKSSLKDLVKAKEDFAGIMKAWETGDSVNLEKYLNDAEREAPVIYKRLVSDRSQRWVPKIEEFLGGDKNAMVIVGAGHLVGKDGVVELLRKKGYKVTQQ